MGWVVYAFHWFKFRSKYKVTTINGYWPRREHRQLREEAGRVASQAIFTSLWPSPRCSSQCLNVHALNVHINLYNIIIFLSHYIISLHYVIGRMTNYHAIVLSWKVSVVVFSLPNPSALPIPIVLITGGARHDFYLIRSHGYIEAWVLGKWMNT